MGAGAGAGAGAGGGNVSDVVEEEEETPTVMMANTQRPTSPRTRGMTPCLVRHPMGVEATGAAVDWLGLEVADLTLSESIVDVCADVIIPGLPASWCRLIAEPTNSSTHDLQCSFSAQTTWQTVQIGFLHLVQDPVLSICG